jgi:8-oxo-dGTP pyrophosphatase MutT (NUDIX family)
MDPTRIDWAERQRKALIPFQVVDGRPVIPGPSTGITNGRNRNGHWGELIAADAFVTAVDEDGHRWLAVVERGDELGWALPGGKVDEGETPLEAAIRELEEEAGLTVMQSPSLIDLHRVWRLDAPRLMPDPRSSDRSWIVSVVASIHLGDMWREDFPTLTGADDAKRAAWVHADTFKHVVSDLASCYGGVVFAAHTQLLADKLG